MSAQLPRRTEVAIVGAGFAGLATARSLADRGVAAIVLEREVELGRHASGRGAGLGRQLAEDDATSALAVRGAARLRERHPTTWTQTGGLLGFDDATLADEYVARAERLGVPHAIVDRSFVLRHWPALAGVRVERAIHVPTDGIIDVRPLLARLADGIAIATGVSATALRPGAVETDRGTLEARVVVDASGAWAGALTADPPLDVFKRHLFVLEAAAPATTPFLWHLGADELYVRPHGDGILVSPCDQEVTEPRTHEPSSDADARLRARMQAVAATWPASIARRWACQRAFAPDRRMRLGRDPARPWLVWAAALGGHGATAACAVGEVVADAVLEALG